MSKKREWRSFSKARKHARALELSGQRQWDTYARGELEATHGVRPEDIPSDPKAAYKDKGWAGLDDWLGSGKNPRVVTAQPIAPDRTWVLSKAGTRQKRMHCSPVGRYCIWDEYSTTDILSDGGLGIGYEELGRLERRAAISVLTEVELIEGRELKFARKAIGLKQPELAKLLGVQTETVSRWETGADSFKRMTQLALLQLLQVAQCGER